MITSLSIVDNSLPLTVTVFSKCLRAFAPKHSFVFFLKCKGYMDDYLGGIAPWPYQYRVAKQETVKKRYPLRIAERSVIMSDF